MLQLLGGSLDLAEQLTSGAITVDGDPTVLATLAGLLDKPDPDFATVTPQPRGQGAATRRSTKIEGNSRRFRC